VSGAVRRDGPLETGRHEAVRIAHMRNRLFPRLLAASVALGACSSSLPDVPEAIDATSGTDAAHDADAAATDVRDASTDGADAVTTNAPDAADAAWADAPDAGYGGDGPCLPGLPRCHGDFGYQMCEQDGTWSESHSCAGYSSNGTTSYCAEIPMAGGGTWATCVDPACWYWLGRGALGGPTPVGICQPDGSISACSPGGTLAPAPCAGACTTVASLDGRAVGYCAPECQEGATECVGYEWVHTCAHGRWSPPVICGGDLTCVPAAKGAVPSAQCGKQCEPGTSICSPNRSVVMECTPDGTWTVDRTCLLGLCRQAGAQAECETECMPGQLGCAFDGAATQRDCSPAGLWNAETPCATGTSCRMSGAVALGCVECVGDVSGGGNAFGLADRRCADSGVDASSCGADNRWQPFTPCEDLTECRSTQQGPSTIASCASLR
jgi:hypothetical protein